MDFDPEYVAAIEREQQRLIQEALSQASHPVIVLAPSSGESGVEMFMRYIQDKQQAREKAERDRAQSQTSCERWLAQIEGAT